MTDLSGPRSPRADGADDQSHQGGFPQQFKGWLRTVFGGRAESGLREALEELVDDRGSPDAMSDEERRLLGNILKLRKRTASDIMVPRADIFAIEIDTPTDEVVRRLAEEAHSRVPVFRETLDDVVGMVHIKDIMASVVRGTSTPLKDMLREVLIVAPSMPVLALLVQMRQTRHHMALVVDEFGGIDGLVTIEDLLEEIVGEIEDEFDEENSHRVVMRPDGSLIADARLPIEDFEAKVGPVLTDEERDEIDTLGGLAFSLAGRVPARGETLTHQSGLEFEIIDADPRRVKRVRVRNLPPAPASQVEVRG
ncbi:MAG TPA: hemolysin family protein [Azospirillaceae bacterium]|nr:hemolysin family protein [Azospirillaceae bacterium]